MIKYLRQYKFYFVLLAFVLIPVIAIDTTTRKPHDYYFYDRAIVLVTYPIQAAISWSLEQLVNTFQNYIYLWHTRQDNLALVEENRRLLNSIAGFRETEQENIRLRKLMHFEEKLNTSAIIARVIAKDVSTEFRAIRINRGESQGVRKNMAVVTYEGVVGRVLRTTAGTSDVVTILDLLSAVDAIDERSRARGVVEGKTDEVCQLKYTVRTDDIQPGDLMTSSGLGGIFQKGIPVGVVSKVDKKSFGISQDVEVRPSVDFSKIEEVMVITQPPGLEGEPLKYDVRPELAPTKPASVDSSPSAAAHVPSPEGRSPGPEGRSR